jgi:hypothetical protein
VTLRLAVILCVALGFFGLGLEISHGTRALYEHWYCITPLIVIAIAALLGLIDVRRHSAV